MSTRVNGATAAVVADSIYARGPRLTTLQLRYPRMVHAECKTHRMIGKFAGPVLVEDDISLMGDHWLSRNGRSSRAVPVNRLLDEPTYMPAFRKNQGGMQAGDEFQDWELAEIQQAWMHFADQTRDFVRGLHARGVHKQWANRPLEWFGFIDTLITVSGDHWPNFFALRLHEAAQPEMQDLAAAIKTELTKSRPRVLAEGDWHLPYVRDEDWQQFPQDVMGPDGQRADGYTYSEALEGIMKISVARCARVSIEPFDGDPSYEAEARRYAILVGALPMHASPAEHLATPDPRGEGPASNLTGWRQLRKILPGEVVR